MHSSRLAGLVTKAAARKLALAYWAHIGGRDPGLACLQPDNRSQKQRGDQSTEAGARASEAPTSRLL